MSVTQQFNTTTSMGRLTLNVLLSFAQFEREVAGERASATSLRPPAARACGWAATCRSGTTWPVGVWSSAEAKTVKSIFERYLELGCVRLLQTELDRLGIRSKHRVAETGRTIGGGLCSAPKARTECCCQPVAAVTAAIVRLLRGANGILAGRAFGRPRFASTAAPGRGRPGRPAGGRE